MCKGKAAQHLEQEIAWCLGGRKEQAIFLFGTI